MKNKKWLFTDRLSNAGTINRATRKRIIQALINCLAALFVVPVLINRAVNGHFLFFPNKAVDILTNLEKCVSAPNCS